MKYVAALAFTIIFGLGSISSAFAISQAQYKQFMRESPNRAMALERQYFDAPAKTAVTAQVQQEQTSQAAQAQDKTSTNNTGEESGMSWVGWVLGVATGLVILGLLIFLAGLFTPDRRYRRGYNETSIGMMKTGPVMMLFGGGIWGIMLLLDWLWKWVSSWFGG